MSHPTSCFWIPAPLWVCVCVLIFFMEKWTKIEREREVFNCNKLAPCGPALSVCVSVHLRCGQGPGSVQSCQGKASAGFSGCVLAPAVLCCTVPVCWLAEWRDKE